LWSRAVGVGQSWRHFSKVATFFWYGFIGRPSVAATASGNLNAADPGLEFFIGVGHKPDTFATMGSAQSCRRYVFPFRIIPALGQVSEYSAKPSASFFARARKQVCDVLHDDVSGLKVANKSHNLGPKPAACPFTNSGFFSGGRNVLAREPSGNDIDGNSIGSKSLAGKCADIFITWNSGPVLGQYFAGEWFNFAECHSFKTARAFKPKAEATNSAEQIEDTQFHEPFSSRRLASRSPLLCLRALVMVRLSRRACGLP